MDADAIRQRLRARQRAASEPQPDDRLDFEIGHRLVGSVAPDDALLLSRTVPGVASDGTTLSLLPVCAYDATAVLREVAASLRAAGRAGRWRNEALPVMADDGTVLGAIERACVRALGIRTVAVHLVGQTPDGQIWLQRRAPGKDTDPNRLDTLAGGLAGMNPAAPGPEPLARALAREVQEEAGLEPTDYSTPQPVGRWRVQRPVPEGFMIEDTVVWHAVLRPGTRPRNRDGEVSEFLCLPPDEVLQRIDAGELTAAAEIATLMCFETRA